MTLFELKRKLIEIGEGLEDPMLEARVILSYLGFSPIDQITNKDMPVSPDIKNKALAMMEKRASGYPMAYITGTKEFWGMEFKVNENVLIPRPDTETLVETAITLYKENNMKGDVMDLCTGSGAIATALSVELDRDIKMGDISPLAAETAKENYERLTKRKADIRVGDLFEKWESSKFSLIVSNPPYLTEKWCEEVEEDVKKEPKLALFGYDDDGLGIIRRIIKESGKFLEKEGYIALECDYRQCSMLSLLLETEGYSSVNIKKDLAGKDRVVYGKYNG
ncbi:MAG: peptide chain release factor N(5)-glutamine methyltransferase [Spirochaetales bacterium]|nr:peptide chain release factor N(5)-glutamine methyltransferase [Spirochaetales bacterium]